MTRVHIHRAIMVLAACGLVIAGLLTLSHSSGFELPCGGSGGCRAVQADPSSWFLGVPVAAFGVILYFVLLCTALLNAVNPSRGGLSTALLLSGSGLLVSVYLTYLSLTSVQAVCTWCLGSLGVMALIFMAQLCASRFEAQGQRRVSLDVVLFFVLGAASIGGVLFGSEWLRSSGVLVQSTNKGYVSGKTIDYFAVSEAPALGDPNAEILIVEFGDTLCGSCRMAYEAVHKLVKENPGKFRYVFRHYPVPHEGKDTSTIAAKYLEIAHEQGKFWNWLDRAYSLEFPATIDQKFLDSMAKDLGLSRSSVSVRLADPSDKASRRLEADVAEGKSIGILQVPTFLVGRRGGSARVFEDYQQLLESAEVRGAPGR